VSEWGLTSFISDLYLCTNTIVVVRSAVIGPDSSRIIRTRPEVLWHIYPIQSL